MASTVFLGLIYGKQIRMNEPLLSIFMRMEANTSDSGIAPIIAKGNRIEGIEAKE